MSYSLTSHEFDQIDIDNIIKLFNSKRLTMGKHVVEFEKIFARFHNRKYAVMTNSGSSANLLMIASLVESGNLNPGDEVIVPAVSWSTTYFPLTQYGLIPVFVDVSLDTFSLDESKVLKCIKDSNIKAILNVPLLGYYAHSQAIKNLCAELDILYLEDCCEAFGSNFQAVKAGELGDMSTFSFFYSHQLPAIEGGCVLTDSKNIYDYLLSLRAHGWTREIKGESSLEVEQDEFVRSFRFVLPGYCLRPTEINAVLATERLKRWEDKKQMRDANHSKFISEFGRNGKLTIQNSHSGMSAFGFGVICESTAVRRLIVDEYKKQGIEVRPIVAGNFTKNPVIERIANKVHGNLENADKIDACGFFLGNHASDLSSSISLAANVASQFTK